MILFIVFGIFAVANAEQLIQVPLGPLDVTVSAGNQIPPQYLPLDPADQIATVHATAWAEDLIRHVPVGKDGIPPLDPYYHSRLPPIAITNNPYASGNIYLKNLRATGLNQVVLHNLQTRLRNNRYDLTLSVPVLNVEVDYEAAISAGILPISYDGHLSILMKGVRIDAQAKTTKKKYQGVPVYQLDGLKVTAHADDVQIGIDQDVWQALAGGTQQSTNEVFSQAIASIEQTVLSVANKVLRRYPATTLLQYLLD